MNWLSKIVINGFEMLIKDATAREGVEQNTANIETNTSKLNRIWNGDVSYMQLYVSPDGDDAVGNGDAEHPYKTITHAYYVAMYYIGTYGNGVRIFVNAGDYYETVSIGSANANRLISLYINGIVNIHGSIMIDQLKVMCFGNSPGTNELHIYQDSTYTQTVWSRRALLALIHAAEFICVVPTYFHVFGGEGYVGVLTGECSNLYFSTYAYAEGTFLNEFIYGSACTLSVEPDTTNAIINGPTFQINHCVLFKRGTSPATYTDWNNVVAGANLTIYTP